MKRVAVIAVLVAGFVAASAFAEEPEAGRGAGTSTCGEFADAYKRNPAMEVLFFTWAQGYMSGWNIASMHEGNQPFALNAWNDEQQMSHIRYYCDAHPLQHYLLAVHDLMITMK